MRSDTRRRIHQYRRRDQGQLRAPLSRDKFLKTARKRGSAEQLAAVREDEEFERNTINASLVVDRLRHLDGVANEEVARQMALYQDSVARVPQSG